MTATRSTRIAIAAFVLAAMAVVVLLGTASPAAAHAVDQSYLYLDIFDDSMEGRVEVPVDDLNEVLGLSIPQDPSGARVAIGDDLATIQAYAAEHLSIGDGRRNWPIEFRGFGVITASAGTFAVLPFDVVEVFGSVPRQFEVTFDVVIESNSDRDALLIIGTDWGSGTFANEADHLLRYTSGNTTQVVDLDDSSWWKGMRAVIDLGVDHIRIGTDHILFIIALVLPSVLVFSRPAGWQPAPSFGSSLWRVMKIVTMFTIAHSVTLTLGGLGIVELPPKPVEAIIAISIALAAIHNIRPVFVNREWLLAFGFGLFHGLGFAGLLSELGIDRSNRFWSLAGFNIGIELGQAVIILLLFPVLFVLRRTRVFRLVLNVGSGALAIVASLWAVERIFDADLRVTEYVDDAVAWPRVFWLVLAAGVVAVAVYLVEARRGRLVMLPEAVPRSEPRPSERLPAEDVRTGV